MAAVGESVTVLLFSIDHILMNYIDFSGLFRNLFIFIERYRIRLFAGILVTILAGLLNLQKREKFLQ